MATHSSILALRIPWTEEPGRLQSMGLKESDTTERLNYHLRLPINNIVMVSGAQQSASGIHMHASIFPLTPLPSRLPHNIKQSSLGCTVGPCWLSILITAVCTHHPKLPNYPFLPSPHLPSPKLFVL